MTEPRKGPIISVLYLHFAIMGSFFGSALGQIKASEAYQPKSGNFISKISFLITHEAWIARNLPDS